MKDFKRGGYDRSGRGGRGFDRGRGGRDFEKRMFSATCAECGDRCEVPFRPTGEKPVLCNNCFRGGDDRGARHERHFDKPRRDDRPSRDNRSNDQLEQINAKLDLILKEIDKLKQPKTVHMVEAKADEAKGDDEKPAKAKKTKKAAKEDASEAIAEEKPAKKAKKTKE
ncbi:MAG: CxxC-x17-CxxC domain-containing protein [Patescibacteria group bacterium]